MRIFFIYLFNFWWVCKHLWSVFHMPSPTCSPHLPWSSRATGGSTPRGRVLFGNVYNFAWCRWRWHSRHSGVLRTGKYMYIIPPGRSIPIGTSAISVFSRLCSFSMHLFCEVYCCCKGFSYRKYGILEYMDFNHLYNLMNRLKPIQILNLSVFTDKGVDWQMSIHTPAIQYRLMKILNGFQQKKDYIPYSDSSLLCETFLWSFKILISWIFIFYIRTTTCVCSLHYLFSTVPLGFFVSNSLPPQDS